MSKKIVTVITDMFEDVEYTEPAKAFREAGHEVVILKCLMYIGNAPTNYFAFRGHGLN